MRTKTFNRQPFSSPLLLLCAAVLLLSGPPTIASTSSEGSTDATQYGDALTGAATLRVAELLEDPEPHLGKRITIEGLIDDVCPMKGCWIDVADAESKQTVRFKVDDGVIEFPTEARGHSVTAEGILRKHELTREQAVDYLAHLAEEKGQEFDETTVTGPLTLYQLEGLGAKVEGLK